MFKRWKATFPRDSNKNRQNRNDKLRCGFGGCRRRGGTNKKRPYNFTGVLFILFNLMIFFFWLQLYTRTQPGDNKLHVENKQRADDDYAPEFRCAATIFVRLYCSRVLMKMLQSDVLISCFYDSWLYQEYNKGCGLCFYRIIFKAMLKMEDKDNKLAGYIFNFKIDTFVRIKEKQN